MKNKKLSIQNQGLLDVNELIFMGCSSKNGVDTIGKFGTGLKYAIAVLVRNNIDFKIFLGTKEVLIEKEEFHIRDNIFEKIIINGSNTSITTNLGVEWEVWQGIREFIANSKDEGGGFSIVDQNVPVDGYTTIVFDYDQIEEHMHCFDFDNWIEVGEGLFFKEIENKRRAKVYKEGFLVYEADSDSSFDYRIDNLDINESRMAENRWQVQRGIAKIQSLMNKKDVTKIIDEKETDLGIYYKDDELSDGWDDVISDKMKIEGGYELKQAIKKRISENRGDEKVKLLNRGYFFVDDSNEKDGVFSQKIDSEIDILWDIDLKTNNIYLWEGEGKEQALSDALDVKEANIYRLENNLENVLQAILHFRNKNIEFYEDDFDLPF